MIAGDLQTDQVTLEALAEEKKSDAEQAEERKSEEELEKGKDSEADPEKQADEA